MSEFVNNSNDTDDNDGSKYRILLYYYYYPKGIINKTTSSSMEGSKEENIHFSLNDMRINMKGENITTNEKIFHESLCNNMNIKGRIRGKGWSEATPSSSTHPSVAISGCWSRSGDQT